MKRFDKCPKCGGTRGYYTVEWVRETMMFEWDGTELDPEYSDQRGGGMIYCTDCGKPICRTATLLRGGDAE